MAVIVQTQNDACYKAITENITPDSLHSVCNCLPKMKLC